MVPSTRRMGKYEACSVLCSQWRRYGGRVLQLNVPHKQKIMNEWIAAEKMVRSFGRPAETAHET